MLCRNSCNYVHVSSSKANYWTYGDDIMKDSQLILLAEESKLQQLKHRITNEHTGHHIHRSSESKHHQARKLGMLMAQAQTARVTIARVTMNELQGQLHTIIYYWIKCM